MRSIAPLFLALAGFSLGGCLSTGTTDLPHAFHVDPVYGDDRNPGTSETAPFRTLERARDAARSTIARQNGDVTITLHGGIHLRQAAFELDDRDSGRNGHRVRYVAADGETPILDGGVRVSGWTLHDPKLNIHRAPASGISTRQLFVNGTRATRARSQGGLANATFDEVGHTTTDTFLAGWKAPSELEFVYERIWTKPRCGVASIRVDGGRAHIVMDQPGWQWNRNKGMTSTQTPDYYENAYELLDSPGEWYHDRTGAVDPSNPEMLYYLPRPGEDLASAEVVAPIAEKLLVAKGRSIDTPLRNLELRGIAFQHTTWLRPDLATGHPDAQNNVVREEGIKGPDGVFTYREFIIEGAAITLKYAEDLVLERLRFERLGGNGINAYAGVSRCMFRGGLYRDVGGTGIQLGDYKGFLDPESENYCFILDPDRTDLDHRLVLRANSVTNNYLTRCGADFPSSTAIAAAFPVDSQFAHNEIEDMPYTGIHIGWAWVRVPRTSMGGNLVAHNFVNNVMRDLNDGGCIYHMGPQRGPDAYTTIRDNYVFRCSNQGIYLDDGASFYHVRDNVIAAIGDRPLKIVHYNKHDIDVVRTYAHKPLGEFKAPRVVVEPAILPTDGKWSAEALGIIESAGLQEAYRDLNPKPRPLPFRR